MQNSQKKVLSVGLTMFVVMILAALEPVLAAAIDYDIVYVRAPRSESERMQIPEVFNPIKLEAGTDLILLHPDGSEEVLIDCDTAQEDNGREKCAVLDPAVSFDGQTVYFSKVADQVDLNTQRSNAARSGADIFKIHLPTRVVSQLTFQEWTPNTGARAWSTKLLESEPGKPNYLKHGIYNLGATPLPGGKLVFTSSRNGYQPNKSFTNPNLQLFTMDDDGANVELIGHMNLGSALHPVVLKDGRIMFSSYEGQGLRDLRLWGLWHINPDGTNWGPLLSAFSGPLAFHWQTQLTDGNIVVTEYYNTNNSGFGTFYKFPDIVPAGQLKFGSPNALENTPLQIGRFSNGKPRFRQFPFSPTGINTITPFAHSNDSAADPGTGKVTQPSGGPNNDLLFVYSPGPSNHQGGVKFPLYNAGLYQLSDGGVATNPSDMVLIKNDPAWNEQQPKAVVPYLRLYGIPEPANLAPIENDGTSHGELAADSPYGLVGTSTFYRRDTSPGRGDTGFDGLDAFNSFGNDGQISSNWFTQGADAGLYNNSDIYAVRVLSMEPTSAQSYGPGGFRPDWVSHGNERLRILGEIPLRKFNANGTPILDIDNNPDTSFLAKIPADVPYTFQTIDKKGMVLNMSQTWHQSRPGEQRTDCGGCHAHSQQPMPFAGTAASRASYLVRNLADTTPLLSINDNGETALTTLAQGALDVEFNRDIKPIIERSCVSCHSDSTPGGAPAGLVLDKDNLIGGYDNAWHRLANDRRAEFGIAPLTQPFGWRQTNRSRYIRAFQSRRSLLMWKVAGERLDGWTNDDHPSATVRGDKTTLPEGGSNAEVNRSDLDFDGAICPPPGSAQALTENEKMMFARWIDLGAPISKPQTNGLSWFTDEVRPTLALSAKSDAETLSSIKIGMHDYYSGLDLSSLSVTASFTVIGRAPGSQLADLFTNRGNQVWQLDLPAALSLEFGDTLSVSVKDQSGNIVNVERTFKLGGISISDVPIDDVDGLMFPIRGKEGGIVIIAL